jgi:membrane-associated protease RseP (regulator of RpoE activity)
MSSLFILWCAVITEVAAFFLARISVATLLGLKGRAARLGLAPEAWSPLPFAARLLFAAVGPFACYLVAAGCFALSLAIGGEVHTDPESVRVTPAHDGPAETAGLQDGDRIVSIDGAQTADWASIKTAVHAHAGGPLPLVVDRAGARVELRPVVGTNGRIGITQFAERRPVSAAAAIGTGLVGPFRVLAEAFRGLLHSPDREAVGPVGIVREVAKTSRDPFPIATALGMTGGILSYFLGIPGLVAVILFPRRKRA